MKDINSVTAIGRLVRDAELKTLNTGTSVAFFTIAVNRKKKTANGWGDEPNFLDVSLYGGLAESIIGRLAKGAQVCVDGELRQERWNDRNGQARSRVVIAAEQCQVFTRPQEGGYQ
jgi:single-strand DNA-binding protein